jgi:hypothetical protein
MFAREIVANNTNEAEIGEVTCTDAEKACGSAKAVRSRAKWSSDGVKCNGSNNKQGHKQTSNVGWG